MRPSNEPWPRRLDGRSGSGAGSLSAHPDAVQAQARKNWWLLRRPGRTPRGGMASSSSSEEKSPGEAEPAPASSYWEEELKQVVSLLETFPAKISKLLEPDDSPGRITADQETRRRLAFLEIELSAIVSSLTSRQPSSFLRDHGVDDSMVMWLCKLKGQANLIKTVLEWYQEKVGARNSRTHLLGRTKRGMPHGEGLWHLNRIVQRVEDFCHVAAEDPCGYRKAHLFAGSGPGLPPHAAKAAAGALRLVGTDGLTKKLLAWLAMDADASGEDTAHKSLRVMAITGTTGVGKTALTMKLHRQLQCQAVGGSHYFQCLIMAQSSWGPDRNELLLRDILSQIPDAPRTARSGLKETMILKLLALCISGCLQDKRYLIIIDGLLDPEDWEKISNAFPDNNCASRIIITTYFGSVARSCCSNYNRGGFVHKMKPLNELDSRRLLLTEAFGSMDGCPPDMKLICDDILRNCEGIPLFITAMAECLRKELEPQEQQQRSSSIFSLEQALMLPNQLKQAISPNYDYLPYELKLVLLYMSMFPHTYIFEKDRLVTRWVEEGLTHGGGEEKAEEYFNHLVDRNFITQARTDSGQNFYEAETCEWLINHYVLQFLVNVSAEKDFVFTSATLEAPAQATGEGSNSKKGIARRLAIHHPNPELPKLLGDMDLSQTRSLSVSTGVVDQIPLHKFLYLVVLDLEGWENLMDVHLLRICTEEKKESKIKMCAKLYLLSYLSIRKTRISKIPPEIIELINLRTLDISHTQIRELPLQMFELRNLQKLDLRSTLIRKVPQQIQLLCNLQCLLVGGDGSSDEVATEIPEEIRYVTSLHTLATVDLRPCSLSLIAALGGLNQLRVLEITWSFHQCTNRNYQDALRSSIQKLSHIRSLTIHCGLGCSVEFLGNLRNPPKKLEKFKVTAGRFLCVPKWIEGLQGLSFLHITVSKPVPHDIINILGELKLQCLILGLEFIPKEAIMIDHVGFLELSRLSIECPVQWLTFRTGAMPKLTYLVLKLCDCPRRQISCPSGINNLSRLTEVALCYHAQYINSPSIKMTVETVRKQVAEHRNPIDLYINGVEQDVVETVDEDAENATGTPSETDAGAVESQSTGEETTAEVRGEILEAKC